MCVTVQVIRNIHNHTSQVKQTDVIWWWKLNQAYGILLKHSCVCWRRVSVCVCVISGQCDSHIYRRCGLKCQRDRSVKATLCLKLQYSHCLGEMPRQTSIAYITRYTTAVSFWRHPLHYRSVILTSPITLPQCHSDVTCNTTAVSFWRHL